MTSFSALMTEMNNLMCAWLDRDMFKYLGWCCRFTSWVFYMLSHAHSLWFSRAGAVLCICCCEYVKDEIATLLPCRHMFHKLCVTLWLRKVMLFFSCSLWKRQKIQWLFQPKLNILSSFTPILIQTCMIFVYLQNVNKETRFSLILFEHPLKVHATKTFMR